MPCASCAEIALTAEAAAAAAESGVVEEDGVDGDAGALRISDRCVDVGAVLVEDAGAAVVGIDAVGDHQDEASLADGAGSAGR